MGAGRSRGPSDSMDHEGVIRRCFEGLIYECLVKILDIILSPGIVYAHSNALRFTLAGVLICKNQVLYRADPII